MHFHSLLFITIAFRSPLPLTAVTALLDLIDSNPSLRICPILKALSANFSSSNTSKALIATREPRGLPPKVEPWVPIKQYYCW